MRCVPCWSGSPIPLLAVVMYIIRGPGNLTYVLCDTTFFLELWFWEVFLTGWWPCTSRTICSLQLSMVWMVSLAGGQWQEPGRNIPPLLHRTQTCNRQPGLRTKDKKILKISIRSSLIDDSQRMWKKNHWLRKILTPRAARFSLGAVVIDLTVLAPVIISSRQL